ncbi:MAG: hypothetical protein FWF02_08970 [Micrococcales bacterium]|nr:hypothetical protein [Micrococcales bacterium]MCL2667820.1 hypothetical protein [Micrococcales bacterium]
MKSIRTTTIALTGTVLLAFGMLAGCSSSDDKTDDNKADETSQDSGSDSKGGSSQAFCNPDPASLDMTDFNGVVKFYEDWKASAPADVKGDFDTIIKAYKGAANGDMAGIAGSDLTDATMAIANKTAEVCG